VFKKKSALYIRHLGVSVVGEAGLLISSYALSKKIVVIAGKPKVACGLGMLNNLKDRIH
jgi:hypothetical protein